MEIKDKLYQGFHQVSEQTMSEIKRVVEEGKGTPVKYNLDISLIEWKQHPGIDGVVSPDQRTKELLGVLGTVRIVRPSDSNFEKGQVVTIEQFLRMVEGVLVNGGEMPIAQLESEGKV